MEATRNDFPALDRDLGGLGLFNTSARHLLNDLQRRSSLNSGEARETSFLYQRISILVQRFNAVLLYDGLPAVD